MRDGEKLMFKIDGHIVKYVPDYGVVAHGLWTTNGHFGYVSRMTQNWVEHGSKITDSSLPDDVDFTDAHSIFQGLKTATGKQ